MRRFRKPIHVEPKGWGREIWIDNNTLYSGKILEILKPKRCPLDYHKLKTESFYLRSGRLRVTVKKSPDAPTREEFELSVSDCINALPAWFIRWKH